MFETKAKNTKKFEAKTKDSLSKASRTDPLEAKNRNARAQGQGPRTQAQVFSKNKRSSKKYSRRSQKKDLQKFFSSDLQLRKTKKCLYKFSARFLAFSNEISSVQKIVPSWSRGQGNFRGLEASRPRPRT